MSDKPNQLIVNFTAGINSPTSLHNIQEVFTIEPEDGWLMATQQTPTWSAFDPAQEIIIDGTIYAVELEYRIAMKKVCTLPTPKVEA